MKLDKVKIKVLCGDTTITLDLSDVIQLDDCDVENGVISLPICGNA